MFGLDYDPYMDIQAISFSEKEDIVTNIAKICRYMNKGVQIKWNAIKDEEKRANLAYQMFFNFHKKRDYVYHDCLSQKKNPEIAKKNMKNPKNERILDEIGEREEGLTDEEIKNVIVVDPVTNQEYSHEEKKEIQKPLWDMSIQDLNMVAFQNDLQGALAREIQKVKRKCKQFKEQKEQEFQGITITSFEKIIKRERRKRYIRQWNEEVKRQNAKEGYQLVYNTSLKCYMVSSHHYLDKLGNKIVDKYDTYCHYMDFEDKISCGEIISLAENIYIQLGGSS
jgi:hypothetical protein